MAKSTRNAAKPSAILARDPYEALTLENDIVGLRLWGPTNQPTLSLGRADIWERRWFAERQPLVTMAKLKELAFLNRLAEVAPSANRTVYNLYHHYDFPCPKPGGQVILGCPFATEAHAHRRRLARTGICGVHYATGALLSSSRAVMKTREDGLTIWRQGPQRELSYLN